MQHYSTLLNLVNNFQHDLCAAEMAGNKVEDVLTRMDYEPSEHSVKSILDFAYSFNVLETDSIGYVEMNLN